MASRSPTTPIALTLAVAVVLAACEEEKKITFYRPMFSGLPGVESATPITDAKPRGAIDAKPRSTAEIAVKQPDGKQVLTARNARELMVHLYDTIKDNDESLFLEQVLSNRTKNEFYERGLDPREAFVLLRNNFDAVKALFDQMPMGEYTPGMYMEPVGPNIQRLEVHGAAARGLVWTGFDMILEQGNYRLRWFVGPGPAPPVVTEPDEE